MKRVLIFSLAYYPHVGGAEVALKEITDRLSDIEFHMVTLNFGGDPLEEKLGNVVVHRVGKDASYLSKMLFALRAAREAARLHGEEPFDAFWAMMSYMLLPIVLLRRRGIRVPYLLTLQEGDPFSHVFNRLRVLPVRFLLRQGFREASAVQTISTYLAGWAREAGYPGEPVVVPNGVDTARFASVAPIAHDGVRLVTTSRLVHKNAVDDVICALVFLPENVRFIVYGTGPDEASLKRLARTVGVSGRVEFRGHIDHADMPAALAECDIFVRPSRSEGMGNSFIEAMAAGLPVIATQEGGIADFLYDAKRDPEREATGWAVDKDSPEQIAAAVRDILAHPDEVRRVTNNAKRLVLDRYDWSHIAGEMRDLFATLSV